MTGLRALVVAGLVMVGGCSSDEATTTTATAVVEVEAAAEDGRISDEEAIRIARREVAAAFEDFDFDRRRAQVVEVGDTLDVSFPGTEEMVLDQEPHVILDAATGEVEERQVRG